MKHMIDPELQDWGRIDRELFLRDSARYRLRRLARSVFCARTFWLTVGACVLGFVGRMITS